MKRFFLVLGLTLFFSVNVNADVCFDVRDEVAAKAIDIISKQKEIYSYCSICDKAKAQVISVKDVKKKDAVYVNDNALDLAHIYFKKNNKYFNLGIISGCIDEGIYGISATLDRLSDIDRTKESNKAQAKQKAKDIFAKCVSIVENDKYKTTQDMVERNVKINNCLENAIKKEIKNGFETEQQTQMLKYLKQARKGVWNFYNEIYTSNKYCYGQCGSLTNLLPYSDEALFLMQMLESLLYLNIAKNGY